MIKTENPKTRKIKTEKSEIPRKNRKMERAKNGKIKIKNEKAKKTNKILNPK